MKAFCVMTIVGLGLMGSAISVSAQPYGGRDYGGERERGYGERDRSYGERERGYGERDRGGYGERERGDGRRSAGFDEGEYLRCNPDVRRAVNSGQMESGAAHFRTFGRREGRRLSC